jgi:hypothetical protein
MGMFTDITKYFDKQSKSFLITANSLIILAIGLVDYVTGYEIALSLFYVIPISIAAWFGGKRQGIVISTLSFITIAVTDFVAGKVYTNSVTEFWNLLMHLSLFVIVSLLVSRLKVEFDVHKKLIVELQEALGEVKQLSGLLPICASCKKIRDDTGYWNQIETYISKHSEATFSHSICPECIKKLYPELADEILAKKRKQSFEIKDRAV